MHCLTGCFCFSCCLLDLVDIRDAPPDDNQDDLLAEMRSFREEKAPRHARSRDAERSVDHGQRAHISEPQDDEYDIGVVFDEALQSLEAAHEE